MFETARYEARRRVQGAAVLSAAIGLYSGFIIWYFTVLEGVAIEDVFEELPPALLDAFGVQDLATIEGFLGAQIYNFVWLLGLGLYFAYVAGGTIASDIESERMDLLLSFPISRARLIAEKCLALFVPLLVVNAAGGAAIYTLALLIGEPIDATHLLLVHLLSIPYLMVCIGIGLVCSVVADRAAIAERVAVGFVFVLFLVESVVGGAEEYDWIQYLSPTHYYDPTPILLDGTYELIDSAILLVAFVGLLLLSQILFQRRDV